MTSTWEEISGFLVDSRVGLLICGAAFLGAASSIASTARAGGGSIGAAYATMTVAGLAGAAFAWRRGDRMTLGLVIGIALGARVVLLFSPPVLSNDAYRYLWDAQLLRAGLDPLSLAPANAALSSFRATPLYASIDYRSIPSLYPPLAYVFFAAGSFIHPSVYGE